MASPRYKSSRIVKQNALISRIFIKEETKAHIRKVSAILAKLEGCRTEEEWRLLQQSEDIVQLIRKRTHLKEQTKQRHLEVEDSPELLQEKCEKLASVIQNAKSLIVYTGAGISTSASIPDYRGPNGVWTLLKQGKQLGSVNLVDAEPTLTHMAIVELQQRGYIKQVVSQNCDGLHLRSGLPRSVLSELHGNMYIETCRECQPGVEYIRLFDVTEKTAIRRHKTGRRCHKCGAALTDTIVHFGERGGEGSPYNWSRAVESADAADVILCLGSSLKVLKKYPCLWSMHKPAAKRPRLYIVNLQWTPKDHGAAMKINGKCDDVMNAVMKFMNLDVKSYSKSADPIFAMSACLKANELKTTARKMLSIPESIALPHLDPNPDGKFEKRQKRHRGKIFAVHPTRAMPQRRAKARTQKFTPKRYAKDLSTKQDDPERFENCSDRFQEFGGKSLRLIQTVDVESKGTRVPNNPEEDENSDPNQKISRDCRTVDQIPDNHMGKSCEMFRISDVLPGLVSAAQRRDFEGSTSPQLCDGDFKQNFDESYRNLWWQDVDSKTWVEALQSFLLHMNHQKANHGVDSRLSDGAFASRLNDDLGILKSGLTNDRCDHTRNPTNERPCAAHESSARFDERSLQDQRFHTNSMPSDTSEYEKLACRKTAVKTESDKEFCTLSDLKEMHNVLFDSKKEMYTFTDRMSTPPSAHQCDDVLPSRDLIQFMHSYCQQKKCGADDRACSASSTDARFRTNDSGTDGSAFDRFQNQLSTEVLLNGKETLEESLPTGMFSYLPRNNPFNRKSHDCDHDFAQSEHRASNLDPKISIDPINMIGIRLDPETSVDPFNAIGIRSAKASIDCDGGVGQLAVQKIGATAVPGFVPGWFGKGLSTRKLKRKRTK